MKSILFVDDEPRLLEGLQRSLRSQRAQWDMSFATSGDEALRLMAQKPFDVVVTDMRMPEMDGATLLERVRERYPAVARIVLSGYVEKEAALRAAPVAHRFLAKPCDPMELRDAIEASCSCAALLPDEAVRRVVGAIGRLPALPHTAALLVEALQEPEVAMDRIGSIVQQDVGMTAKILQLVNSAFFGLAYDISSVRMAVSFLGLDTLRQLVMTVEIFRTFRPAKTLVGFSLDELERHSQLAARIAGRLPGSRKTASAAIVASVLHDAGKLVLASRLPKEFETALIAAEQRGLPLHLMEAEVLGASHAEIGAYLLGLWGLPEEVVDAVARHHHPTVKEGAGPGLDVLAITHLADALSCDACDAASASSPAPAMLDLEYVEALGVGAEIPGWRAMSRQVAEDYLKPAGVA
jgi:HD-like signal output (HDOD) protein/ActR/RegA family two-component response regulator